MHNRNNLRIITMFPLRILQISSLTICRYALSHVEQIAYWNLLTHMIRWVPRYALPQNAPCLIFLRGKNFKLQKVKNVVFVMSEFLITIWFIINLQTANTKLAIRCDLRQYYQCLPHFPRTNLKVILPSTFRCWAALRRFFCRPVFYLFLVSFPVYFTIPVLNDLLRWRSRSSWNTSLKIQQSKLITVVCGLIKAGHIV